MANILRLQNLDTIHGWGNARLVNTRVGKPSELAIMAMTPAYVQLRTRKQGDRVLSVSFHLAHLGQVRHEKRAIGQKVTPKSRELTISLVVISC